MTAEYPKWVYLFIERIKEKVPDINHFYFYPYYSEGSKFPEWVFQIYMGKRYATLLIDKLAEVLKPDERESLFDFYIEAVVFQLEQ